MQIISINNDILDRHMLIVFLSTFRFKNNDITQHLAAFGLALSIYQIGITLASRQEGTAKNSKPN
uniref:Uncharacterized protein n=1 Tax=Arundo donax TaxID=35708 RepID=A0A0A9HRJ1_ARUDO